MSCAYSDGLVNFLAHLVLDHATPAAAAGALLPDLVRGRDRREVRDELRAAVARHRLVDTFTDHHPLVARSKARVASGCGRYAGVLMDVFYDHLLSAAWADHAPDLRDRPTFIADAYTLLRDARPLMPAAMWPAVERMIGQDWLGDYATEAGLRRVLGMMAARMTMRFGRVVSFDAGLCALLVHRAELAGDFRVFFPQLAAAVAAARAASPDAPATAPLPHGRPPCPTA